MLSFAYPVNYILSSLLNILILFKLQHGKNILRNKNNLFSRTLNRSVDFLFATSLLDKVWSDRLKGKAICLCYHRVDDASNLMFLEQSGLPVISPQKLRQDIQILKKLGFRFITFAQWRDEGNLDPQRPNVILTFDDGYKDQYQNACPVLESEGVKAVFFQTTGMVHVSKLLWQHLVFEYLRNGSNSEKFHSICQSLIPDHVEKARMRGQSLAYYLVEELPYERSQQVLEEARRVFSYDPEQKLAHRLYPSEGEIQEAHAQGHEIACHGDQHLKRSCTTDAQFEKDLVASIAKLRHLTGEAPATYAFPHGDYYGRDLAVISKYFSHAVTVEPGVIDDRTQKLKLPRFYWGKPPKNSARRKRWLLTGVA
jgi:peptidoglycan/xylan/chitin deacetylase (PgdA/CDA1 family)